MKKNMRRLMALSLAAALALTALTGCGGNASSSDAMSVSTGTLAQEENICPRGHHPSQREPGDRDGL